MASDIQMPGPVCLIENTNTQLVVNPEALKILSAITQPVVVVAIVGLYRTGKSYLMNKLAGQKKGFSLGSTVQSHTKGIWMWCVPHPKEANYTLVLLDTEGLGDVEKGDNQNDSWIFALAILLSSTFVYNSMGTINQQAMDQLHLLLSYVTELTDKIRAKSSPDANEVEDSADFVSFFPDFVWTLRDFSLELEVDGQPISADEYLQNSLKLKQGSSSKDNKFNLPRLCIRKFFPKKKCFIFDRPTHRKKLGQLETMHDDELDPEFIQQAADFGSYIFTNSKVKTLSGGILVNGPRLETLVLTYVDTISSGDLPCMENAVLALAQIENSAAVQKAIAHYDQQMGEKVELPTETLQELLDLHMASEKEAIEVFMKNSFKDVDHLFQKELAQKFLSKGVCVGLENLVLTYANAISSGDLPCMENAILASAHIENSTAVQKAVAHYDQQMGSINANINLAISAMNFTSKEQGTSIERQDQEEGCGPAEVPAQLEKRRDDFCKENMKASSDRCSALLKDIFHSLEEEIKQGVYSQPGGYRLLMQTMNELKKKYLQEPRKGIQSEEVLQTYLSSKESVIDAILQTDQSLTEKEKEIEVQRVKAESAEAAAKMLEEMQKKNEQMMEEKEKSYQEHVKQLTEKMEQERAQLMAEQERALALKLKEQALLLKEGFQNESKQLQREIENLKNMKRRKKKKCIIS
ncbi:hypothetical protein QTO34_018388 [Cnephaeus nilssonii]|uniref:GB1/RHD3-type G domain-containing protein n=1 Tax=Cnephaeus nilssonii TaxID=3371016 RepID=A0AA40HZJ0_CNENI|nr:hypothetical protein QTO34_018388 [Eptesicus nilssonii]